MFTSSKNIYLTLSPLSPCGNTLSLTSYNTNSIVSAVPSPKKDFATSCSKIALSLLSTL